MISLKRLLGLGLTPLAVGLAVAAVTAISVRPGNSGEASSHREAPLIAADPQADTTDVYAFIAPDAPDMVTLVGNWIPFEEPSGGPNFYNFGDDVLYEFDIDYDGDAVEDVAYAFHFRTEIQNPDTFLYNTGPITSIDDAEFNYRQYYDVFRRDGRNGGYRMIASNLAVPPNNVGENSIPDYDAVAAQGIHDLPGGGKVFAGQRDDPFFIDLGASFDLLQLRPGGALDTVDGFNTNSIVLQVPIAAVTECGCMPGEGDEPVIGIWSDTYRNRVTIINKDGTKDSVGRFRQVSRLGNPLVNEVVIPLRDKDKFNASDPKDDGQFLGYVTDSVLAATANAVFGFDPPIPATNRQDLVTVFLTGIPGLNQPQDVVPSEQLRLNVGIAPASCGTPNRLGAIGGDNCGFPNGRRLADDVTDIALRAVSCGYGFALGPCPASFPNVIQGDGVDTNDKPFLGSFPYVAAPHSGYSHEHDHGAGTTTVALAGVGGAGATLLVLVLGAIIAGRIRVRHGASETVV